MSFFGFDPSRPPSGKPSKKDVESYDDFEETYEGFGDYPAEADDALNAETFGDDIEIGKDFDFGSVGADSTPQQPAPQRHDSSKLSYASAAQQQPVDDILQPMASLWGSSDPSSSSQSQLKVPQRPEEKILSLEEIEAQLLEGSGTGNSGQVHPQQIPPHQMFPPPPGAFPNFMLPPGAPGFPPPQMMYNNQPFPFPPPPMGVRPQFQQSIPIPLQQQQQPQQQQPQQLPGIPQQRQQQFQAPPLQQQQNFPQQPLAKPQALKQSGQDHAKPDLSQFPVLGSSEPDSTVRNILPSTDEQQQFQNVPSQLQQQQPQQQQQQQQQQQHLPQQHQQQRNRNQFQNHNQNPNQQYQYHQQRPQYNQLNNPDLSPEERARLLRRQEKVARITKYSGVMNPRDKDYVTRFQLSQIITEDPYNEDFYYQVFKVINNQGTNHIDGMSSIAQNYLEQSGHRLGGKHRRVDVALQRMQQQVSKAVTVAKERGPKQGILTREGALGKVSYGTVKQPKTKLVIRAKEGDIEINADNVPHPPAELKFSKSSRKFHLYLIEKLYGITLRYESLERENLAIDNNELVETIFNKDDSNDDSFIYIFNYEKGMKLFPRFFRFLSYEEKLQLLTLIFKNLQRVDIIMKSSYKNYIDSTIPTEINKKIETFQLNVLKNLVLFLSEAKFSEVLNLLIVILTQNNLLFLCTTKIGLSFITISISRLELIKQEFANNLSTDDLSTWSSVYDSLFQHLEGKLTEIFPPSLSSAKNIENHSIEDDSYIWQFLASLSLAGKLNHQRIIVDEIRDEIFGVQKKAKNDIILGNYERANKMIGNLNLFLNVMGLKANEDDISELN